MFEHFAFNLPFGIFNSDCAYITFQLFERLDGNIFFLEYIVVAIAAILVEHDFIQPAQPDDLQNFIRTGNEPFVNVIVNYLLNYFRKKNSNGKYDYRFGEGIIQDKLELEFQCSESEVELSGNAVTDSAHGFNPVNG